MYQKKKKNLAFTKPQENNNTKGFFSRETMGNLGMKTDTKGGLNMPSLQLSVGTNLYQSQCVTVASEHGRNSLSDLIKFPFLTLVQAAFQDERLHFRLICQPALVRLEQ